jgi:hypothetical protein
MAKIAIQPTITRAATAPAVIFAFSLGVVEWSMLLLQPANRGGIRI